MIENAEYADATGNIVLAEIDGRVVSIPVNTDNHLRRKLLMWEAAGNRIAAAKAQDDAFPRRITARQLRLMLHRENLLDRVDGALSELPEPQRTVARIEWEHATEFESDHQMISQLGHALGLDETAILAFFEGAARI